MVLGLAFLGDLLDPLGLGRREIGRGLFSGRLEDLDDVAFDLARRFGVFGLGDLALNDLLLRLLLDVSLGAIEHIS